MVNIEYYARMFELKPYDPVGIKHEVDPENGYSVLVVDKNENYPNVWMDVRINHGLLYTDYNMWIFHDDNEYEQTVKAFIDLSFLNDDWLWDLCADCAEGYLISNNLIKQLKDGTWISCPVKL